MQVQIPHKFTQAQAIAQVKRALDEGRAKAAGQATIHEERWDDNILHFDVTAQGQRISGTVTSINGNTFVVDGRATTTVTVNGDTKIVSRDGATTTAAITEGSRVIAFGSTTATSTSGNSFTASVVIVFNKAMGHLKHWLRF